jgi:hypothetical protein
MPSFRRRIAHPLLCDLYDYWLAGRGNGIAMPRASLDPVDIPQLLRFLILSEVGDDARSIRYRLVGTEIVAAHGMDYTGMTVQELTHGATLAYTYRLYEPVVTRGLPVYSEGRFRWPDRDFRLTKRLHLPLTRNSRTIDMVLSGQVFEADAGNVLETLEIATRDELATDLARLAA